MNLLMNRTTSPSCLTMSRPAHNCAIEPFNTGEGYNKVYKLGFIGRMLDFCIALSHIPSFLFL